MQACRAYYEKGRSIPFEPLKIPEGSQAIITVLDSSAESIHKIPGDISDRQKEAVARFRDIKRNSDPLPPEFDDIMNQRYLSWA